MDKTEAFNELPIINEVKYLQKDEHIENQKENIFPLLMTLALTIIVSIIFYFLTNSKITDLYSNDNLNITNYYDNNYKIGKAGNIGKN
mgnify:CR=1 FL=1